MSWSGYQGLTGLMNARRPLGGRRVFSSVGLPRALRVLRERIGSAVFGSALDDGVLSVDRALGGGCVSLAPVSSVRLGLVVLVRLRARPIGRRRSVGRERNMTKFV